MAKTFRAWEPEPRWLLPPAIEEFVPPGHLAHVVRELVREELDLSAIVEVYDDERGQPPYHPVMMTALLLYAYCQGVYASRRIAQACEPLLLDGVRRSEAGSTHRFFLRTGLDALVCQHRRGDA